MLNNKKILIGISGGIASYKCAELIRRLKEHGAQVRVIMTESAKEFITPLTIQAVSGEPVSDNLLDPEAEAAMGHIALAKWADIIVIAPATANTIAKITAGLADDLLSTVCLATDAPIAIVPAMNQQMYASVANQENLKTLTHREYLIWGPASGPQACGDIGKGRMIEPNEILHELTNHFNLNSVCLKKSILITAGPTIEPIDPVRYISNHSSGKMGFALAEMASKLGYKVFLVSGPVNLKHSNSIERINITTADEMLSEVKKLIQCQKIDVFIGCAAIADFKPVNYHEQKIKKINSADQKSKKTEEMTLTLTKNPDILRYVANLDIQRPFTVGFCAETQNLEENAKLKLINKKLDLICANDVSKKEQGFNSDQNSVTLYWGNKQKELDLASKEKIAMGILNHIQEIIPKTNIEK